MPVVFPVVLQTYLANYGRLRPMRRRFDITDGRSYAETMGGEAYVNSFGTQLWFGSLTVTPLHLALMRPLEARMRQLLRADAVFLIGDPMDDPAPGNRGNPTIGGVNATTGILTINGLTGGYVVPAGLRLSFRYGSRYAYHETTEQVNASGGGSANVEVTPPIEPGWSAGTQIRLGDDAYFAARIVPQSWNPGDADAVQSQGFSFNFRQTLRT